ncbi:alpha/beta hydrolase family protein [Bacteroides fragilis]|nr:alpha/beta hydrolase family protein [Bacteroides fragilis]
MMVLGTLDTSIYAFGLQRFLMSNSRTGGSNDCTYCDKTDVVHS